MLLVSFLLIYLCSDRKYRFKYFETAMAFYISLFLYLIINFGVSCIHYGRNLVLKHSIPSLSVVFFFFFTIFRVPYFLRKKGTFIWSHSCPSVCQQPLYQVRLEISSWNSKNILSLRPNDFRIKKHISILT